MFLIKVSSFLLLKSFILCSNSFVKKLFPLPHSPNKPTDKGGVNPLYEISFAKASTSLLIDKLSFVFSSGVSLSR